MVVRYVKRKYLFGDVSFRCSSTRNEYGHEHNHTQCDPLLPFGKVHRVKRVSSWHWNQLNFINPNVVFCEESEACGGNLRKNMNLLSTLYLLGLFYRLDRQTDPDICFVDGTTFSWAVDREFKPLPLPWRCLALHNSLSPWTGVLS